MAFHEVRFNTEIRYGTIGGPEFSTTITVTDSGFEQRNINWSQSRGRWVIGDDVYNKAQMDYLIAFYRARQGRAHGFRLKDWSDWTVLSFDPADTIAPRTFLAEPQGVTAIAVAGVSVQLYKRYYGGGGATYDRIIKKPVTGTVTLYNAAGNVETLPSLDYTTGLVTGTNHSLVTHWEGEFDVPVRFDSDRFEGEFSGYAGNADDTFQERGEALYTVNGLSIVEIRQ